MKALLTATYCTLLTVLQVTAQQKCFLPAGFDQKANSYLFQQTKVPENTSNQFTISNGNNVVAESAVIRIPVIIHNLYHFPEERITDAQVAAQLEILNKSFRRQNSDTATTPSHFKEVAADIEIEFHLATSDPQKRSTTGINRKYTPVKSWLPDDKMKLASETGTAAWDSKSYLNIWVCNLDNYAGYSSVVGGPAEKDGIVISYAAFGEGSKTIVHETGHWLNLKHLWGDDNCGDDGVADTPKQASYTVGCPTGIRRTCGNTTNGDMYMNYMDFTNDECVNLFTEGQKTRMRALFTAGAVRNSILSSKGLDVPLIFQSPLPEEVPVWLKPNLYPNPATTSMKLDLSYDIRWMGKTIFIMNLNGQTVMTVPINSKVVEINISKLQPGMYFLATKKEDGESIKQKFIKL